MTLTQPDIRILRNYRTRSLEGPHGGTDVVAAGMKVYEAMKPLRWKEGTSEYRFIWIKVPRGPIEAWHSYEDWALDERDFEGNQTPTKEQWIEEWKAWHPHEQEWYRVSTAHEVTNEGEWLIVSVDDDCVLEVNPRIEPDSWEDCRRTNAFLALADCVQSTMKLLYDGTYGALIDKELPYSFRWGFMKRSVFWEIAGDDAKRLGGCLPEAKAFEIAGLLDKQPPKEDTPHLESLSARQYFDALKEAYVAAGIEKRRHGYPVYPDNDSRSWYCSIGDARDQQIFEIDQESPEAMREFMEGHPWINHGFEVILGRGCSRVHLWPVLDEDGWYLHLSGHFDWHATEMALMWRKLNEMGVPTYISNAAELAKLLRGEDLILIAPKTECVDYMSGSEKFGRKVGLAIHLWEEYRRQFISAAEWMPAELPELE